MYNHGDLGIIIDRDERLHQWRDTKKFPGNFISMKSMIVQKSFSSLGGLYDIIDDFIEFKTQLGILSNKKKKQCMEVEGEKEMMVDNKLSILATVNTANT